MSEQPYESQPTNSLFLKIVASNTTTVLEGSENELLYQPFTVQINGTLDQIIELPDPLNFIYRIGNVIQITNPGTGTVTVKTANNDTVGTVASGGTVSFTKTAEGRNAASITTVGGTGTGGGTSAPVADGLVRWNGDQNLSARMFNEGVRMISGNYVPTINNPEGPADNQFYATVMYTGSGGNTFYLPVETECALGMNTTYLNISPGNLSVVLGGHGDSHTIPPGFGVRYIMTNPGGSYQAWKGEAFQVNGFGFGERMSFTQKYTYGSLVMNVPNYLDGLLDNATGLTYGLPFNLHMDSVSDRVTVVNNFYNDRLYPVYPELGASPRIYLPDVSTIPVGATYEFYFQNQPANSPNPRNLVRVGYSAPGLCRVLTHEGVEMITQNVDVNVTAVCLTNNPGDGACAWSLSTRPGLTSPFQAFYDFIGPAVQLLAPYLLDFLGKGLLKFVNRTGSTGVNDLHLPKGGLGGEIVEHVPNIMYNDTLYPMRVLMNQSSGSAVVGTIPSLGHAQLSMVNALLPQNDVAIWSMFTY